MKAIITIRNKNKLLKIIASEELDNHLKGDVFTG